MVNLIGVWTPGLSTGGLLDGGGGGVVGGGGKGVCKYIAIKYLLIYL